MNTFFPLILCISVLQAAETPTPADRGPSHGKVLVLENDQTLAGDIERAGDLYRVRRLIGETTVPAERVLRLCADMEEAYAFLRSRANLADADEHLRLGEWCRLNGLHDQALAEVKAAVELRRTMRAVEGSWPIFRKRDRPSSPRRRDVRTRPRRRRESPSI